MHLDDTLISDLSDLARATLRELETDTGILASAKDELFGCIFGRDSLITALNVLRVAKETHDITLLSLVEKILSGLADLQGTAVITESGEEPGKIIHEFRATNHEHLTRRTARPWYTYPDGTMRNFDTADATPLFAIAVYRYLQLSPDSTSSDFLRTAAEKALDWILLYGDSNNDGCLDYHFSHARTYGGLRTHSWMDSSEALFHEDGTDAPYPIAPVEVQGYAYCAYLLWERFFVTCKPEYAHLLEERAATIKQRVNDSFIIRNRAGITFAFALDGTGRPLTAARSSVGHLLWSSLSIYEDDIRACIVEDRFLPALVDHLMHPQLFEPNAGIRTLSTASQRFNINGYHNGTIWPHDTSIIAEGLERMNFPIQAWQVRRALLNSYAYFKTPLELFSYDATHKEFCHDNGQRACQKQAWSAASLLKETHFLRSSPQIP